MLQPPAFVAFTGVDTPELIPGMQALSRRYPIEWGVLVDFDRRGEALFPTADAVTAIVAAPGLRLAAHVCGDQARLIADAPEQATIDLAGFQRVQVNHGFAGSTSTQVANVVRFGRARGQRMLLQTLEEFPEDTGLDWLFDTSFGTGRQPTAWPPLPGASGPFCGYSGGIGPASVAKVLTAIGAPAGAQYWIDMESGVRSDSRFDLDRCAQVCRAVYGS